MMKYLITCLGLILSSCVLMNGVNAQEKPTHIGYVYPAGAQQGSTVRLLIGGQRLRGVKEVFISGEGVKGKVIEYYPYLGSLGEDRRRYYRYRMTTLATEKWNALKAAGEVTGNPPGGMAISKKIKEETFTEAELKEIHKSKHYLFNGWDEMPLRELVYNYRRLTRRNKLQPNAQISEAVLVEITVDADAELGNRELRLRGFNGLSQPMVFQIGDLPEQEEVEGNDPNMMTRLPEPAPFQCPVVINGQILPGDVDQLKFQARAGQPLVIEVQARRLVPFLPDAVPGWFQPVVTVLDTKGNPIQFADDFHYDPDPVMFFKAPEDGVYTLVIHDAIHRGREDFVYRISISEKPYVYAISPMGGQVNESIDLKLKGWNLTRERMTVAYSQTGIKTVELPEGWKQHHALRLQVDEQASIRESYTDNILSAPFVVDGEVSQIGEKDAYRFHAKAEQRLTVKLDARRLGSRLDGLIRVVDQDGQVIAWEDDSVNKQGHLHRGMGVLTHFADASLTVKIPKDGQYTVTVSDVTQQGGLNYGYRLRVQPVTPDFQLFMEPSAVNLRPGMSTPVVFHVIRKDGFEGPVRVEPIDLPSGFSLTETIIPAGQERIRVTLTAPAKPSTRLYKLKTQGAAFINNQIITHEAEVVDDQMQAFLWRHLLPRQACMVSISGGRKSAVSGPELISPRTLNLKAGRTQLVRYKLSKTHAKLKGLSARINDAPEGITIESCEVVNEELQLKIKYEHQNTSVSTVDYLMIEISVRRDFKRKNGKPGTKIQFMGYLPALPYQIKNVTP